MCYEINEDFLRTDIDNEAIILDTEKGVYLKLNETSQFILNCIKKDFKKSFIIKSLTDTYNVSSKDADICYERFVKEAEDKRF